MPYGVGHVTRFSLEWRDSVFEGVFRNILHFRGTEATMSNAQMLAYITDEFPGTYLSRVRENMRTSTDLRHIKVENLTDLDEPSTEITFGVGDLTGGLVPNDDDIPQACACITRKSFLRGRKAVGHYYFGPLSAFFIADGLIDPSPTLGGDLQEVMDALGDPLIDGVTGWQARPIVCNAAGTGVVANNDVRVQSLAQKAVFLKSRRPGVGE